MRDLPYDPDDDADDGDKEGEKRKRKAQQKAQRPTITVPTAHFSFTFLVIFLPWICFFLYYNFRARLLFVKATERKMQMAETSEAVMILSVFSFTLSFRQIDDDGGGWRVEAEYLFRGQKYTLLAFDQSN